jgi:hypothetical protein
VRAVVVVAGAAAVAAVVACVELAACGQGCRNVDVKPVSLECSPTATFNGEIHFDDAATFASFLVDDCLLDAGDDERQAVVDSVDFTKDAVFVSSGVRQANERCISERKTDGVDVCDDGLRVGFADTLTDDDPCPGRWTVAFAIGRSDMRAALDTPVGF